MTVVVVESMMVQIDRMPTLISMMSVVVVDAIVVSIDTRAHVVMR